MEGKSLEFYLKCYNGKYARPLENDPEKKGNYPYMKLVVDPKNPFRWYAMYIDDNLDLDDEYMHLNGMNFIFEYDLNKDVKFPPKIMAKTENGVFRLNENICVQGGAFHPETYNVIGGPIGFAAGIIEAFFSGFKDLQGLAILGEKNRKTIYKHAKKSKEFNETHNKQILELFEEHDKTFKVMRRNKTYTGVENIVDRMCQNDIEQSQNIRKNREENNERKEKEREKEKNKVKEKEPIKIEKPAERDDDDF